MAEFFPSTPESTRPGTGAPLNVTAQRRPDGVVISVRGEIDLSNVSSVESEIAVYAAEPRLVFDLSEVSFCGVAGAHLLHRTAVQAAATGRRFEVVVSHVVARVLATTGLAAGIVCLDHSTPGGRPPG